MKNKQLLLVVVSVMMLSLAFSGCTSNTQSPMEKAQNTMSDAQKSVEEAAKTVEKASETVEDAAALVEEASNMEDEITDATDATVAATNTLSDALTDLELDKDGTPTGMVTYWAGVALSPEECGGALVKFAVQDGKLAGTATLFDEKIMKVSGTVSTSGKITAGIGVSDDSLATFSGTLKADTGEGTWNDIYGCEGVFSVEAVDNIKDPYHGTITLMYGGIPYSVILYNDLNDVYDTLNEASDFLDEAANFLDDRANFLDEKADYLDDRANQLDEKADQLDDLYNTYY